MPFKSQAQKAKFGELVKQGKMKQTTFDEWNKSTGNAKLPERVGELKNERPRTINEHRSIAEKKLKKY